MTACISFNLDTLYTLVNLLFAYTTENFLISPIFAVLSLIISPGYFIITILYPVFLLLNGSKKIRFTIVLIPILFIIYCKGSFSFSPFSSLKNLYYNYYWFKNSRPNFGLVWVLLPSTFLKYQNYTLIMILFYQITLSLAVMLLVLRIYDKDYPCKKSLAYILIFYINHIFDRYPSENHQIIILCILLQHYEIIKVKILNLAIYCCFASYTLIVCRGFPFTHRKTGSSNYLFYQNLTYEMSQIMVVMFSTTGINEFRKKLKLKV